LYFRLALHIYHHLLPPAAAAAAAAAAATATATATTTTTTTTTNKLQLLNCSPEH